MKLIALLAFRNEEQFLRHNLPQLRVLCDVILGYDDESTDNSREIFSNFGDAIIPTVRTLQWGNGGEFQVRDALLRAGRQIGGTHFICLDADELFTSDNLGNLRDLISELPPGSALSFKWISCWEDPKDGKFAYDPNSVSYKDFIFADKAGLEFPNGLIHFSRTPTSAISHVQSISSGGVLHLQNFNYANFIAKQLWYQLSEVLFSNHPYYYLDYKYLAYTKRPKSLVPLNPSWIEDLQEIPSQTELSEHWQQEIIKMLCEVKQHNIEYLGMWSNPALLKIYQEFYGATPRKKTLTYTFFDVVRLRIFILRSYFAKWRLQNFKNC